MVVISGVAALDARALSEASAPRTLVDLFQDQVAARPDDPAMFHRIDGRWESILWKDYALEARHFGAYLVSAGVQAGEHVAIWSFNRPEFLIASTATMLAGGCTAPLYQTLSADEAAYVLGHCDASVAVVENAALLAKVLAVRDRLPALRRIVLMEGPIAAQDEDLVISWGDALQRGAESGTEVAAELVARANAVRPSDIATLVYTSGTTGPPKAVMATQANLIAAIDALGPVVKLSADDRVLSYLPLAHILERLNSEIRLNSAGSPLWFASSIAEMPAELREVRPTCFVGVPRVWEKMAATITATVDGLPAGRRRIARWAIGVGESAVDRKQRHAPSTFMQRIALRLADRLVLREIREATGLDQAHTLITGAAPMAAHHLRFFHALGLELLEGYGMSENMTVTTLNRRGRAHIGTVGQALPGVELHIADDGEIWMRGDVVFAGYYKDPVASAATVVDGWLHTGDIGELDADGYLRITDRKKDLIITAGGKNISPTNIEDALRSRLIANPVVIGDRRPYIGALLGLDMAEVVAFGVANGVLGDEATLIAHPLLTGEVQRWVDSVNEGLARVEQVRRWVLLPGEFTVGVELTPTFKVRRKVVAERYAAQIEELYSAARQPQ
jgi:long-chain acyl-CoA synthetase